MKKWRIEMILQERDDCEPWTDQALAIFISGQVMEGAFVRAVSVVCREIEEQVQ